MLADVVLLFVDVESTSMGNLSVAGVIIHLNPDCTATIVDNGGANVFTADEFTARDCKGSSVEGSDRQENAY